MRETSAAVAGRIMADVPSGVGDKKSPAGGSLGVAQSPN
jgi:hypothetical protein